MKKIMFIAQGISDGGSEKVASILSNYFVNNGYAVKYVCFYNSNTEYILDNKIEIVNVNKSTSKNSLKRELMRNRLLRYEINEYQPTIIISFINIMALLLFQIRGIPVVYSLRNNPFKIEKRKFLFFLKKIQFTFAKGVVFQSESARKCFNKKIQNHSVVFPNPINVRNLPYWDIKNRNNAFVTLCRLNKQKNIPLLVNSFVRFHEKNNQFILEIYGQGELQENISQLISFHKAQDYIFLKGRTSNPEEVLSKSFAFCLSSDYEGLSNSMLEALAIGIPCICTDCPPGSAKEYIIDGYNGYLTTVGDEDSFIYKMNLLVSNQNDLAIIHKNSILIRELIDSEVICKKWVNLIEKLTNKIV